jgi:hypothetical protein
MTTTRRKPVRLLHHIRVDEFSAVNRGAAPGARIAMLKRHHGYPPELCRAFAKNADVSLDPDEPINPSGDEDDEAAQVEMDTEEDQTMKSQLMSAVVKHYGITAFCESVAAGGVSVSEHELTKLIDEAAQRKGTTFAKLFTAQDEQGVTLRKAIAAARDAQFLSRTKVAGSTPHFLAGDGEGDGESGKARERFSSATLAPRVTGGRAATAVDNPKSALAQLQELVDAQRAQHPTLSEAQVFAQVYADPKNAELTQRERNENRPAAGW